MGICLALIILKMLLISIPGRNSSYVDELPQREMLSW